MQCDRLRSVHRQQFQPTILFQICCAAPSPESNCDEDEVDLHISKPVNKMADHSSKNDVCYLPLISRTSTSAVHIYCRPSATISSNLAVMSSIMTAESSRRGSPASTSTDQLDQTPTHLEPTESSPDYSCCPTAPVTAPVYLLSPDGSRLWLLDSTKPTNEAPPPYSNAQWRPRSSSFTTPRPTRPAGVRSASFPERSTWRSIIFGDEGVELTESTPLLPGQSRSRTSGWRRYWRPLGRGEYWRPLVHLLLVNLPFVSLGVCQTDCRTSSCGHYCWPDRWSARFCLSLCLSASWSGGLRLSLPAGQPARKSTYNNASTSGTVRYLLDQFSTDSASCILKIVTTAKQRMFGTLGSSHVPGTWCVAATMSTTDASCQITHRMLQSYISSSSSH